MVEYLIRFPDGEAYITPTRSVAFQMWQDYSCDPIAFDLSAGTCRFLESEFEEELEEDEREARTQAAHERAFAPSKQTHGGTI